MRFRFFYDENHVESAVQSDTSFSLVTQAALGGHLVRWSPSGTASPIAPFYYYAGTTGNDTIYGTDLNTPNSGLSQSVVAVYGDAGDDLIYAPSDQTINIVGGAGYDIASYQKFSGGLIINFNTAGITDPKNLSSVGPGAVDVEEVIGTGHSDVIFGDSHDNTIREAAGLNILVGGGGNDHIYGGSGTDLISAGGHGRSTIDGGGGVNTLNIQNGFDAIGGAAGATISMSDGTSGTAAYADGSTVTFTHIQTVNGTALADTFIGSSANDVFNGGLGNDIIRASGGIDAVDGGSLKNGEHNRLDYSAYRGGGLLFDLTLGVTKGSVVDQAAADTVRTSYYNITDFYGSAGDDVFNVAPDASMTIDGRGGNDVLNFTAYTGGGANLTLGVLSTAGTYVNFAAVFGTGADDTIMGDVHANKLFGGLGNDTLEGGGGDDTLDGGAGKDTLSFAHAATGITLNLTSYFPEVLDPNHQYYPVAFQGQGHDGFYTYQNASGTYVGTFFNVETYLGSANDDRLFGGWSNDTIDGGAGNDYFRAGIGDDVLTGGDGNDLIFAGPGNDTVYGGNNNDYLTGGLSGDDFLYGGNGDDVIEEYSGLNTMTGGAGHDTFVFDGMVKANNQVNGDTHDTLNIITDFHAGNVTSDANADILDLSPLLTNLFYHGTSLNSAATAAITSSTTFTNITGFDSDHDQTGATLAQYVRVVQVNGSGDYHVQINVDSKTTFAQIFQQTGGWTDVAILQGTAGTNLSLDQLLANHEIIFAVHQQQSQAHGGTLAEYPYVVGDPTLAPYFHPTLPVPNHP
ncbi:MAG TPA: calcium-binding protein [Dongiaceae bacterium]|nr:calcium-binding protein [Dongiaceae bacterium]